MVVIVITAMIVVRLHIQHDYGRKSGRNFHPVLRRARRDHAGSKKGSRE
jgi:hypothetical protein